MKSNLFRAIFCAIVLALGATQTWAGPLRRADVAAEPTWLAHIDFDLLRPTALGQYLLAEMAKPEAQARLAAFQAISSIDLRTQLHDVTLYGIGNAPQDGILLVHAEFDPERLVTLAKAAKEAQNSPYKQHVIYSWLDQKKKRHGVAPRVFAAIAGSRVVFGQSEQRVGQALDVLDGASPNLASSLAFAQLGAAGDTSFLEGVARKMELPEANPHAALLKLSQSVRLQVSEAQGQLTANLTLNANDEEVAGHMMSVAQGLLALAKLQKDNPDAARFVDAVSLKQDGAQVVASLALPESEAVAMMKAAAARKALKHAAQAGRQPQ